ncbi:cell division protein ZapA [Neofamilia massiliensis]|uniref:cell division protein ZapA n=1 Tax=Neofamilia massiliensis TaxID=1673724 RepID=UPI0006BB805A|nr:cell division protein ZapA [Neofamilia massiliensis]
MVENNKIRVEIDGINFTVSGNADEKYVRGLADFINNAIAENEKSKPYLSKLEGIILLSLNLKDQLEKEKAKYVDLESSMDSSYQAENLKKISILESQIESLKKDLRDRDIDIKDYKSQAQTFDRRLAGKDKIIEDLEGKLAEQKEKYDSYIEDYDLMKNKLEIQESLNYDRNKEIITLKNNIRALKEEISRLEK